MRTSLFISAFLIATAISPESSTQISSLWMYICMFLLMDVVEFSKNLTK